MTSTMHDLVVGLDGTDHAATALRWASAALDAGGRLHAVHVLAGGERPDADLVLGGAPNDRERAARALVDEWLAPVLGTPGVDVRSTVVAGAVADALVDVATRVGASALVVGHHPHPRLGPQVVGHVTAQLLRHAELPVVVVPDAWDAELHADDPIVVGVGIARASATALRWAIGEASAQRCALGLVHAYGPRSLFRPDGLLDVLAYHLDPGVLPTWVEEDLVALAERIGAETGYDVEVSVSAVPGRIGPRLVEAGAGARMLVIGRSEDAFHRHAMAPYLRHALVHAPCPIVVVPAGPAS